MRVCAHNFLAVELEDQTQHTMSGGMLRSEVDSIVPDLAVLSHLPIIWGDIHMLRFIWIYWVAEALVDRDEASTSLVGRLIRGSGIMTR